MYGVHEDKRPEAGIINCTINMDSLKVEEKQGTRNVYMEFDQVNGTTVKHWVNEPRINDPEKDKWKVTQVNSFFTQIAKAISDAETYGKAIAGAETFEDFANRAVAFIKEHGEGKELRVLFTYPKKGGTFINVANPIGIVIESASIAKEASRIKWDDRYHFDTPQDPESDGSDEAQASGEQETFLEDASEADNAGVPDFMQDS